MRKKFLFMVVCTTIMLGGKLFSDAQENEGSSALVLANIEALAQDEAVRIPCEPEEGSTCTFNIVTPSGELGTATAGDAVKVD